jgi:hypothetical protein
MKIKISPYMSSLISDYVSRLLGKSKGLIFDTETGLLYYKNSVNKLETLPNQKKNLKKIYDLLVEYSNSYTDFEYNINGDEYNAIKSMEKVLTKLEKQNKTKKRGLFYWSL